MWFFKKKSVPVKSESPKKYRRIKYHDPKNFDIGCTVISITLKDGRKFETVVYGCLSQYIDEYHIQVGEVTITSSDTVAKQFLNDISTKNNFVDDPLSPTEVWVGEAIHAEIIDEYEHDFEHKEAYCEEYYV